MKPFLAAAMILLACLEGPAVRSGAAQARPSILYELDIPDPLTHLFDVEMALEGFRTSTIEVAMPAWSPGVYAIRDYARNVQQFQALAGDRVLPWTQTDKQTWRIAKNEADDVRIRYQVYSLNLTSEMAEVAVPATFMYVVGHTGTPVGVRYEAPGGWRVHTGLEKRGDRYAAADYETFAEAPAFIGQFKVLEFESAGRVPYRVVFSDSGLQATDRQIEADLEDLTTAAEGLFGNPPYRDYTFLVRIQTPTGTSSLGHLNSQRMTAGENDFVNQTSYSAFLTAASQGLVHAWIGKRIRPASMRPYDYSKEAYTRLLWFTEGVSAYAADLLLVRAGILTPPEYYSRVSAEIDALQHQSGRVLMSLEEASWNAWARSDNSVNSTLSYLLKGKIAGLLLDLEIRGRTSGARSLDDVLRHLAVQYGETGIGLADGALPAAIQAATGVDVRDFLSKLTSGRGELDYNRTLQAAGLQTAVGRGPGTIQFGIEFERTETNQPRIRRVLANSPAEAARLDLGDVLVALDSERVTFDNLTSRIHAKRIGKAVAVAFFRGERLMTVNLVPAEQRTEVWSVQEAPNATPAQVQLRNAWLGTGPRPAAVRR